MNRQAGFLGDGEEGFCGVSDSIAADSIIPISCAYGYGHPTVDVTGTCGPHRLLTGYSTGFCLSALCRLCATDHAHGWAQHAHVGGSRDSLLETSVGLFCRFDFYSSSKEAFAVLLLLLLL